jgi:hypothetical protein
MRTAASMIAMILLMVWPNLVCGDPSSSSRKKSSVDNSEECACSLSLWDRIVERPSMKSATNWKRSSRDCGFIAWPEPDCTLAIWSRAMGKKITTLYEPRPTNRVVNYQMLPCQLPIAAFSLDCKFLASRRCREPIFVWNLQSQPRQVSKMGRLPDTGGHKLIGLEFSSDSRLLVAVAMNFLGKRGRENAITVWEVAKRRKLLHVR